MHVSEELRRVLATESYSEARTTFADIKEMTLAAPISSRCGMTTQLISNPIRLFVYRNWPGAVLKLAFITSRAPTETFHRSESTASTGSVR